MVPRAGTGWTGLGAGGAGGGGALSRGALAVAVAVTLTQQGEVRLVFRLGCPLSRGSLLSVSLHRFSSWNHFRCSVATASRPQHGGSNLMPRAILKHRIV